MKTYVKDEKANKQINIIATLVSSGKSAAEIADHLIKAKVVNLAYAEVFWTAADIERIRVEHVLAHEGMKLCPQCRKEIQKEAIKCRHCRVDLTSDLPAQESYAEFEDRFVAGIVDNLVLLVPHLLVNALLPIVGLLISLIVGAAYYMYCLSYHGGGRTVGYRVMNLRLVDQERRTPIPVGSAALWYLFLFLFAIIGWIWIFFDSQKRMLHNIASHTIVINERKEDAS